MSKAGCRQDQAILVCPGSQILLKMEELIHKKGENAETKTWLKE
jgi:hypothetical protein